jgi:hypothetical protein
MIIMATIITTRGYSSIRKCAQIDYIYKGNMTRTIERYPVCEAFYSGENVEQVAAVPASMRGDGTTAASALGLSFGAGMWLALFLHAAGVEIYVSSFLPT